MNYEYICAGNVMLDSHDPNPRHGVKEYIGGPSTFAYSGIRIWTDKVMQVSRVGEDYHELFDPWIERNNVETKGFNVVCDRSNHTWAFGYLFGMGGNPEELNEYNNDIFQDFGYLKTNPEEIGRFTEGQNIKGVYLAQNIDRVFWRKLGEIKQRDGFKMMWEIEGPWADLQYLDRVRDICTKYADVFSINIAECENLFRCKGDKDCIAGLQTLDVDLTLFRVGERGLYVVTRDKAIYLPPAPGPVVDTYGCGNTSTGSALYAYCEGKDPLMVGIMANIASARNLAQFGIIPEFEAIRDDCWKAAEELYLYYKDRV
ncbi:MAG: carbohydrate kinase family protein [Oscillospiraceae bacterium]|nr:carbohydrate kinase family protein [Oscillospiraceae bacterium]